MEQHSDTFLDNASEALKNTGQAERRDRDRVVRVADTYSCN